MPACRIPCEVRAASDVVSSIASALFTCVSQQSAAGCVSQSVFQFSKFDQTHEYVALHFQQTTLIVAGCPDNLCFAVTARLLVWLGHCTLCASTGLRLVLMPVKLSVFSVTFDSSQTNTDQAC